ncbi:U3 small nucleolar RNA-associated protein 5, partial [Phenoliferia sp. Uapishka_3]
MGKKSSTSHSRTTSITPASLASTLTSFSSPAPAKFYAHLHRAPDAHTLRVFEFATGKCVSRWASEEGEKVACLEWAVLPSKKAAEAADEDASKRGSKKRRKSDSGAGEDHSDVSSAQAEPKLVLALGMEDGSIVLWSPTGSDTTGTKLAHPSSTAAVTALSYPPTTEGESAGHLWSAHADGSVFYWDLASVALIGKLTGHLEGKAAGTTWDDLAVRYVGTVGEGRKRKYAAELVLARKNIRVFTLDVPTAKKDAIREAKAVEIAKCTGHVGETFLHWIESNPASASAMVDDEDIETPLNFLSYSPTDRFVQIWTVPSSEPSATPASGSLLSRFALDSPVQSIAFNNSTIAAVDSEGKASVGSFDLSAIEPKAKGVRAIKVETTIGGPISQVAFGREGTLCVCRAGVKPVFELVTLVDETGARIPEIELVKSSQTGLLNGTTDGASAALPARYAEASSTVRSGAAVADKTGDDSGDEEQVVNTGALDVDMAEPTLAERLRALDVQKTSGGAASDASSAAGSSSEDEGSSGSDSGAPTGGKKIAATTLTTTLIQALHSSDGPLLESCLEHTNPTLIRTTVKRIPSGSLVLGLLEALVERLGKKKRGKEGSASVKRARGLIEWVRQTLVVHVGFLVTIPSLVTRLATLHASLTSRLALQPTLLALNGRLELVMSQIELRQEKAVAAAAVRVAPGRPTKKEGKVYVEGESSSEDENADDSEGSIEDIGLGGSDDEGASGSEDEDDEEDGSDDEASRGGKVGDLLELEASEGSEEESEGSEEDGEESEDEE